MEFVRWLQLSERRVIKQRIGLLGATSLVGERLISMVQDNATEVHAFSRKPQTSKQDGPTWHKLSARAGISPEPIKNWFCVAPIWVLQDHFSLIESYGLRHIVVLSSTSRFTKTASSDEAEKAAAVRLAESEDRLISWAMSKGIQWVILRPTLIYGLGRDKNITEIAGFIKRFGFFPLLGEANGLRQPIHVDDVGKACIAALKSSAAVNHAYNISGGETVAYREMIIRIFVALHRSPRLLTIPLAVFALAVACMRLLPRYRHWSVAMAERMNSDLVFDHSEAERDFGFSPRQFQLSASDMP